MLPSEARSKNLKFVMHVHQGETFFCSLPRCPFLEGPEKVLHLESHSKISNLMIFTELFYCHNLNTKRGCLHTKRFKGIQLSVFRYRLIKNGFQGLSRNGTRSVSEADVKVFSYTNLASVIQGV